MSDTEYKLIKLANTNIFKNDADCLRDIADNLKKMPMLNNAGYPDYLKSLADRIDAGIETITTVKLDDPAEVINSLQARIKQLETQNEYLKRSHSAEMPLAVAGTINRLRLHGVILLDVEATNTPKHKELSTDPVLRAAYEQVWILDQAPLSSDVMEAVRKAAGHGMNRW